MARTPAGIGRPDLMENKITREITRAGPAGSGCCVSEKSVSGRRHSRQQSLRADEAGAKGNTQIDETIIRVSMQFIAFG